MQKVGRPRQPSSFAAATVRRSPAAIVFLLACVMAGCLPDSVQAIQFSKDSLGDNGTYQRNGDVITYQWTRYVPGEGPVDLGVTHSAGNFRLMQDVYRRKAHKLTCFSRCITDDLFRSDLYKFAVMQRNLERDYHISAPEFTLSFVQSLQYDDVNQEYQRFAVETLIDGTGDCCDTVVLYAGILDALGYGCMFLEFPNLSHLAVGIKGAPDMNGIYYVRWGMRFYSCETTGSGLAIGECPVDDLRQSAYLEAIAERC